MKSGVEDLGRPRQIWDMDIASYPEGQESKGHRYILLVQDRFSRQLFGKALMGNRGVDVAGALQEIFASHGAPLEIVSDAGPDVNNRTVTGVLAENGVYQHLHEKNDWRVNAQLDRAIKTMKRSIALRKAESPGWEWSEHLNEVLEGENAAPNKSLLGAAPEEVDQMQNPELHFTLERRAAERMYQNEKTILRRADNIRRRQGFDALLPLEKKSFRRGHEARFDEGHRVQRVEGNMVITTEGKVFQARRGRAAPPP